MTCAICGGASGCCCSTQLTTCDEFDDYFNRANESPPTGWTPGSGTWNIVSNQLQTASSNAILWHDGLMPLPQQDHRLSVTAITIPAGSEFLLITDGVDDNNFAFASFYYDGSKSCVSLGHCVGGTFIYGQRQVMGAHPLGTDVPDPILYSLPEQFGSVPTSYTQPCIVTVQNLHGDALQERGAVMVHRLFDHNNGRKFGIATRTLTGTITLENFKASVHVANNPTSTCWTLPDTSRCRYVETSDINRPYIGAVDDCSFDVLSGVLEYANTGVRRLISTGGLGCQAIVNRYVPYVPNNIGLFLGFGSGVLPAGIKVGVILNYEKATGDHILVEWENAVTGYVSVYQNGSLLCQKFSGMTATGNVGINAFTIDGYVIVNVPNGVSTFVSDQFAVAVTNPNSEVLYYPGFQSDDDTEFTVFTINDGASPASTDCRGVLPCPGCGNWKCTVAEMILTLAAGSIVNSSCCLTLSTAYTVPFVGYSFGSNDCTFQDTFTGCPVGGTPTSITISAAVDATTGAGVLSISTSGGTLTAAFSLGAPPWDCVGSSTVALSSFVNSGSPNCQWSGSPSGTIEFAS